MTNNNSWLRFKAWVNGDFVPPAPARSTETKKMPRLRIRRRVNDGSARKSERRLYQFTAVLATVFLIGLLLVCVTQMPLHGTVGTPDQNEVQRRYIEQGMEETGAANLVAGMILDYRAFDTFGESCVLFLSAMAVLMLLRKTPRSVTPRMLAEREEDEVIIAERDTRIFQLAVRMLFPFWMVFGIYIILCGHISPGGGFSGGVVLGTGLILYSAAFRQQEVRRFFTYKTFSRATLVCLCVYAAAKTYSFFTGANHLHSIIPKGTPGAILSGGLILPLNICVGIVVACTMYAFFALFTKGEL